MASLCFPAPLLLTGLTNSASRILSLNIPKATYSQRTRQCARVIASRAASYKAPSSAPAATELDLLEEYTNVVPDTALMATAQDALPKKAGTSSCGVLRGILQSPVGLQQFKTAVERALVYDRCAGLEGDARADCQLDKALVNVAALFAGEVQGRVSTEVDPRTAFNRDAIVKRGRHLVELFKEVGVPPEKYLLRIPATWQGIQAARVLENEGVATHLILIYSFVQAAAAAQAGISVISPNIGRIGDFYQRNPGAIRNPRGPREDAGVVDDANPGVGLVQRIYNYVHAHGNGKSVVMASGVRTSGEALQLSGVDYMTVGPKVLSELQAMATMSGYNDGLSGSATAADVAPRRLSPEMALQAEFSTGELAQLDERSFNDALGRTGVEMLQQGVQGLVDVVERLLPQMSSTVVDAE